MNRRTQLRFALILWLVRRYDNATKDRVAGALRDSFIPGNPPKWSDRP